MKYKSSLTKGIKLAILLLLLFWVVNFLVIINSNGIKDVIVFSVLMFGFIVVYITALVKGTYIVVENNSVEYVQTFVLRRVAEIGNINKVQKDLISGLYESLSLIYKENGKIKDIKISTITFKKDILKQFVTDLKNKNPQIDVDQSVNEYHHV